MSDTTTETELTHYGYIPSVSYGVIFLILFLVSFFLHTFQLFKSRTMFWMSVMSFGTLGEVIGWILRLQGHSKPANFDAYVGQLAVLVIAPTFFSAALYVALGIIIQLVAPHKSIVSARVFKIVFVTADVISLVIQALGGGIAGSAKTEKATHNGSQIMLGGIIFQLLVMIIYVLYMVYWTFRARTEIAQTGKKMHYMLYALFFASLCVIARGIFRTVELDEGFDGYLATTERYILVDAIPIAFAAYTLNVIHPAWYLRTNDNQSSSSPSADGSRTDIELARKGFAPAYERSSL